MITDFRIPDANWTTLTDDPTSVAFMSYVGPYRASRRCIDPPRIGLSPVEGATLYDIVVSPFSQPERIFRATSSEPDVDLASIWDDLPYDTLQISGRAFAADGRPLGVSFLRSLVKSPGWIDHVPDPFDYHAVAEGVLGYICDRLPTSLIHPEDPAYAWHATAWPAGPGTGLDMQFPALCYPQIINFLLMAHQLGLRGDDLVERCIWLADFMIAHPLTTDGPLAGLPMSTMDPEGKGGMRETDRTTLVRIGWTGASMLRLAEATGEARFADYARHLGEVLLRYQAEDGSWPYRVLSATGEVVESYTAASVMALFLVERLAEEDERFAEALERGLAWVVSNPVRTGLWQQMYEDIPSLEDYENLEQWAPIETAIMLLRRNHPDAVAIALKTIRYVEDQFVLFGDEPSLLFPYLPYTPCAIEQYRCPWPMDIHTSNYARLALAVHEATDDPHYAHKAIAAANTVARCQRPDGRLSTLVPDRRFGTTPWFSDWFSCMAHAAENLLTIGPRLTALAGKESL